LAQLHNSRSGGSRIARHVVSSRFVGTSHERSKQQH